MVKEVTHGFCRIEFADRVKAGVRTEFLEHKAVIVTDCAVVVLCEGTEPDPALTERAKQNEVNLILTGLPVYEAAVETSRHLG